jgi:hypothetical protein
LIATEGVFSQLREPHLYPELSALRTEMENWRFYHGPTLLEEIDLETGQISQKEQLPARLYSYEVVPTCGTVLLLGYNQKKREPGEKVPSVLETEVRDLVTGKQIESTNFNSIRCTTDSSVVLRKIGPPWATLGTLFIGATGDNILARDEVGDFGVSNNGKYVPDKQREEPKRLIKATLLDS